MTVPDALADITPAMNDLPTMDEAMYLLGRSFRQRRASHTLDTAGWITCETRDGWACIAYAGADGKTQALGTGSTEDDAMDMARSNLEARL